MPIKITTDIIIEKIRNVHNDTYDLSEVDYVSMKHPIILICKEHGKFSILPNSLVYQKSGCSVCGKERSEKSKYKTFDEVLEKCKVIHGDRYDYSLVKEYKDTSTKYQIICKMHGVFYQNFENHMSGRGCLKCGREKSEESRRLTQEEVYRRCINIHGDKYEYLNFKYINDREKIDILCKKHGIFKQSINNHINGSGCPSCSFEKLKGVYNKTLAERNKEEWLKIPAIVYYVKFITESEIFWKVGITTDTVNKRFKYYKIKPNIISELKTTLYDAVYKEDRLLEENKDFKYKSKYLNTGSNECFRQPILFD
jgi:formate dehydrogenase assembly factor FdhD